MVEKHVEVVTKPSNRAKGKDAREKKVVFKAMLDNPFRIRWYAFYLVYIYNLFDDASGLPFR